MNEFMILFKHELKTQFPLKPQKGKRIDILGTLLSVLMVFLIAAVFVTLLASVVENYALVKINRVSDPIARTEEMLSVCYLGVIAALTLASLENMRRTLTEQRYKEIFLRMPVKHETIFYSKLLTLLISNYALALLLIAAVNVIFYISAPLEPTFWLMSIFVWLFMPIAAFLFATLLLIPYIKLMEFISSRYLILFVTVTSLVMGAFLVYSRLLGAVQSLLETGSIKYLFNEKFINTLGALLKWGYPANCFAGIALSRRLLVSFAAALGISAIAVIAVYFISKKLFFATLYKNETKSGFVRRREQKRKLPPILSLMKKEFISIFRDPKSLFSYFAIAASMPLMIYCCYTLFESLILNMLGMRVDFPLALIVVLIFTILTNTFSANNVTREGAAAMKVKVFPVKASTILLSKVLLCDTVSSLSIIASVIVLGAASSLGFVNCLAITLIAIAFSTAEILIATRMDLGGARLSSSLAEMKSASNRTIAKVVTLGIILALAAGLLSLVAYIFAGGSKLPFISELGLTMAHAYLLPSAIAALYLGIAVTYYAFRIDKGLEALTL